MDKSATKIIIIDDELRSNAPLIVFLQQHFEKVELYKNASDGIKKIENMRRGGRPRTVCHPFF